MATFFWRELLIRFTACSLCILTYCNLSDFLFGSEGGNLVLIASVHGRCFTITFYKICVKACLHQLCNLFATGSRLEKN